MAESHTQIPYKHNLHIVEATMRDQTGHGYSYVTSLIEANKQFGFNLQIWHDRQGENLLNEFECQAKPHFFRSLRRLQKFFLYRKLLKTTDSLFIGTTEQSDLLFLDFLSKWRKNSGKIFCHFHQYRKTNKKISLLQKIAKRNPNITILAPTTGLIEIFQSCGFQKTHVVPCPTYSAPKKQNENTHPVFQKLIYAGAARSDKGFSRVVELLSALRKSGDNVAFEIQVSPPNSGRYDDETTLAVDALKNISGDHLTLHHQTLDKNTYQQLFVNSVCLLLYQQKEYENKFSGVALDALYAGCPIITMDNTWMGDMVKKFKAGISLKEYSIDSLIKAVVEIRANFAEFHLGAIKAGRTLSEIHDPANTLRIVFNALD